MRDVGLIPGSGRSPGGGHGNPLQYSCLEKSMDRGAWQAIVYSIAKSWTWLKRISMHHKRIGIADRRNSYCPWGWHGVSKAEIRLCWKSAHWNLSGMLSGALREAVYSKASWCATELLGEGGLCPVKLLAAAGCHAPQDPGTGGPLSMARACCWESCAWCLPGSPQEQGNQALSSCAVSPPPSPDRASVAAGGGGRI